MTWPALPKIAIIICSLSLGGCAAVESEVVTGSRPTPDGLPYFLPRRPFVITVSTPVGGGLPSLTVAPGNAEPDLSKEFVLSQGTNLLAQNEFNIAVGTTGLLMSSQSAATSEVATTVQNVAMTVGMLAAPVPGLGGGPVMLQNRALTNLLEATQANEPGALPDGPQIACPPAGTSYQYIVYPEGRFNPSKPLTFCGETSTAYSVSWERADRPKPDMHGKYPYGSNNSRLNEKGEVSGLFFRHELPYLVTITGNQRPPAAHVQFTESHYIVASPDESETDFFPINRSFFANNTANITVTDGVITGVDQTTQSEVASFTGLPATFISTYMTAVGQVFSGITNISSDQQQLLQQEQATAAAQRQAAAVAAAEYQACRKTVASFDFTNMSAAEATAAAAAIKAACTSN